MGAIKSYPASELTRVRRAWLTRHAGPVMLLVGSYVGIVWLTTWAYRMVNISGGLYILGLVHAGMAAAILHLLNMAVLAHNREAVFQLRGAWGEDNTRSELR